MTPAIRVCIKRENRRGEDRLAPDGRREQMLARALATLRKGAIIQSRFARLSVTLLCIVLVPALDAS